MPRALEHGAFSGLIGYFPIQNKMPVNRMEQEACMEQRIAILGIIVEDEDSVERVNELLHEYREYIVGRMGMPYRERKISVISIVLDAGNDVVSALSGKLGMLEGVSAKAVYSKK